MIALLYILNLTGTLGTIFSSVTFTMPV
ncbi:MAG: photosystem II reaction center protein T [Chitinophagaceae bacterium]|nr:photosystem II reaction center protein T [Chitinophagaceae bacterium]MBK7679772.1 photosystem II reaction center protein T [Chitinophagaceae bacterium]MBK8298875.1 photosystem II reaction center protein T [Chitinophagaceae bacterium]MBK9659944.1 photosystem II reaction center protein T [Chitinophagaceae bacterium]MBK9938097.1 photosystem II reaction center protein T [Chitinophagaceae bacterium]